MKKYLIGKVKIDLKELKRDMDSGRTKEQIFETLSKELMLLEHILFNEAIKEIQKNDKQGRQRPEGRKEMLRRIEKKGIPNVENR